MSVSPEELFKVAGYGFSVHVVCSFLFRLQFQPEEPIFSQLFTRPVLGGPSMLQGKYFLPWVSGPKQMADQPLLAHLLFLAARLGAMVFALGFVSFVVAIFIGISGSA